MASRLFGVPVRNSIKAGARFKNLAPVDMLHTVQYPPAVLSPDQDK